MQHLLKTVNVAHEGSVLMLKNNWMECNRMQRSGHATHFNFRHLKIVCLQLHLCDTPAYGQTVKKVKNFYLSKL